jgi:hypothetical protein
VHDVLTRWKAAIDDQQPDRVAEVETRRVEDPPYQASKLDAVSSAQE